MSPKNFVICIRWIFVLTSGCAGLRASESPDGPKDDKIFMRQIHTLLYNSQFDLLNDIVSELDKKQSRFSDGLWKLEAFFNAVSQPNQPNDPESWKSLSELLEKWDQKGTTIYTVNAMALTQLHFAWHVRTNKYSSEVADEQWVVFNAGVEKSLQTIQRALAMKQKCVDVDRTLLHIGLSQGWPREKMDAVLNDAITLAPDYYGCYIQMSYYRMERYYGKEGDWQTFLNSLPERVSGDAGLEVYTRVAVKLHPYYKNNFFGNDKSHSVNWPTMKSGFDVLRRTCPDSSWNLNQYAYFAVLAKDVPTARKLVRELVDSDLVRLEIWHTSKYFEEVKEWALREK